MINDEEDLLAWAADCEQDLNLLTRDLLHDALYASFPKNYESRFYTYALAQTNKTGGSAQFQAVLKQGGTLTQQINVDTLPIDLCLTLLCKTERISEHYTSLQYLVDAYAYLYTLQGVRINADNLPVACSQSVTSACQTTDKAALKKLVRQAINNLVRADDIALSNEVFARIKGYLIAPPVTKTVIEKASTNSRRFLPIIGGIVAVCCLVYGTQHLPFVSLDSDSSSSSISSVSSSDIQTYAANYKLLNDGSVSLSTLFKSEESALQTCYEIAQAFWDEADFDLPTIDDSASTTTDLLFSYVAPVDETLEAEQATEEVVQETTEETVQILDPTRIINYTPNDQDENIYLNEYGDVYFLQNPQYEEINIYFGAAVGAIYDSYGRTIIVLDDSDCVHFFSTEQNQYGSSDNITYVSGAALYYHCVIYNVSSVHYMNGYTFLEMNDGSWQRVGGSFAIYSGGVYWVSTYSDYTLLDVTMIDDFISQNVVKLTDGSYLCIDNQDGNLTFESFTVTEGRSIAAVFGDIAVLDDGSLCCYSTSLTCNTNTYQAYSETIESVMHTLMDENVKLDKIVRLCDAYYLISTQDGTLFYLTTETGALSLLTENLDALVITTPQESVFVCTDIDWSTYAYAVYDDAYLPVHVYLEYMLSEPSTSYTLDDVTSFYNGGVLFATGMTYPNANDTSEASYSGYVVNSNGDLIAFDELIA